MGYPMTWKRLIARNGLTRGDYSDAGELRFKHNLRGLSNVNPLVDFTQADPPFTPERAYQWYVQEMNRAADEVDKWTASLTGFLGDLRRLEHDAVDEKAICQHIAQATGIDVEAVATVLKEFFAW